MGEPEGNFVPLFNTREITGILPSNGGKLGKSLITNPSSSNTNYLPKWPVKTKATNLVSNVQRILVCLSTWQTQQQTLSKGRNFQPQH